MVIMAPGTNTNPRVGQSAHGLTTNVAWHIVVAPET
jgi:hypothetical protein